MPDVLFVGESPPTGAPPDFVPFDCNSGDRLAKVMGLVSRAVLLAHVPRANIFDTPGVGVTDRSEWDKDAARARGQLICCSHATRTVVALGRRPAAALGIDDLVPWGTWRRIGGVTVLVAPHPSGRASVLGQAGPRLDARRYLMPELVIGCPALRPWHFDLDDVGVLVDLGAAISPHDVALGVAIVRVVTEVHRAVATPRGFKGKLADYRATADVGLPTLALHAAQGAEHVADLLQLRRGATELYARAKPAAVMPEVQDYPVAVLRATIGRHAAI